MDKLSEAGPMYVPYRSKVVSRVTKPTATFIRFEYWLLLEEI